MEHNKWQSKVILIAEDERINYLFLKTVFEPTGASILWAKNGREAIDLCSQNHVDIVIMDIKMPDVDGNQATRQIKELNPAITVIAQTSYSRKEDREQAFEAGCDSFLAKPVKPDNLFATVEKYL